MQKTGMRKAIKLGTSQFDDWELQGKYTVERIIGQGSYGKVAKAKNNSTGKRVAIKKMDGIFDDEIDCKRILREISLLRLLRHPCLVQLIEILMPTDPAKFSTIYMVLEYAESDMKKILKSSLNLEINHIETMIYNLLCAVKYIHESKVIHRDMKPANILVNEDCSIKLCDFGLARSLMDIKNNSDQILKVESTNKRVEFELTEETDAESNDDK